MCRDLYLLFRFLSQCFLIEANQKHGSNLLRQLLFSVFPKEHSDLTQFDIRFVIFSW